MGQCYNTTVVNAPVDEVWSTVRNFHDMSWAEGVITSVEKVGESGGTEVGARRILNGAFHETLHVLDDQGHSLTYSIDDGPGPVARDAVDNYRGILSIMPVTDSGQTFVEWKSVYDAEDPGAVGDFCDPIYQALLGALKANFT